MQSGNMVLLYRSVCIELKFAVPPHLSLEVLRSCVARAYEIYIGTYNQIPIP